MPNLSHIVILLMVFSFMTTVVSLLPSLVNVVRERYLTRVASTTRELDKFFLNVKVTHLLAGSVVLGALIGLLASSWIVGIVFTIASIFVPRICLSIWKGLRTARFEDQLADGMILIGNALRSGLDIATGIELVATDLKPPISEEFGLVLNAYRLGGSLEAALIDMTRRIHSNALETAVGAIVIQRETGGNLIKTFDQLIVTIREESKLQKKILALSSQGRTQIAVLSALPWVFFAGFYFIAPDTIQTALADSREQIALVTAVFWELLGVYVTKRIVTVDV